MSVNPALRERLPFLVALAVITPLGFATKSYGGPAQDWVRYSAGGVLYVVFFVLLAHAVRPGLPVLRVALVVFLATSAVEVLQLWHPPFLEALRSHRLGRVLLGNVFSWSDFPHYALGAALGAALVHTLRRNP